MMLSVGKIFWLVIILIVVWYLFKIIEKRKLNSDNNTQKKWTESLIFTERFLTSSISETTKSNNIDTKKLYHLLVIGVSK